MQIAHYSHLSVRRYAYPYAIFNGLSGKALTKRPRARFSCRTMTTNLEETFRESAVLPRRTTAAHSPSPRCVRRSAMRSFREIEKTWVQEHQEQTVTTAEFVKFASDKSGIDLSDWSKTWLYGTEKPSAWPTEATAPTTDPKPEATVTSLSVDATRLKKTEYRTGEQFDPTGLKITATYSDKSTKAIDPTDEAVTYHYDFAKPSGAAKSTVTYDGQTASFTVKVTADAGNKTGNNPKQQASPAQNGNAVAVLATSMMTVVIASFGDRLLPSCGAGGNQVSCDAVAQYRQGIRALPDWRSRADVQAWWPAYSGPKAALTAVIVFALTQYGSVLFVKTMIREYGKRSYLVASWGGGGTRRLPSPGSPSICGWVSSRSSC